MSNWEILCCCALACGWCYLFVVAALDDVEQYNQAREAGRSPDWGDYD